MNNHPFYLHRHKNKVVLSMCEGKTTSVVSTVLLTPVANTVIGRIVADSGVRQLEVECRASTQQIAGIQELVNAASSTHGRIVFHQGVRHRDIGSAYTQAAPKVGSIAHELRVAVNGYGAALSLQSSAQALGDIIGHPGVA